MNEHKVSLSELKEKVGNAILLATTRNCRFVVTRYGTPMGAVVGFKDLQRLKKLDEAEGSVEKMVSAEQKEKERLNDLILSICDRILLGEELRPTTEEEWDIMVDFRRSLRELRVTEEGRKEIEVLTESARLRRDGKAAA